MSKRIGRSVPLEPIIIDKLKDPEFAAEYLSASFDSNSDEDFEVFFDALSQFAKAQGISNVAKSMNTGRDTLYKAFKSQNPTVRTLRDILRCLDLDLAIVPKKQA